MKLFVRGLFACAWLVAGLVFTGCGSPSQGQLFGQPPAAIAAGPQPPASSPRRQTRDRGPLSRRRNGQRDLLRLADCTFMPHEEPIKEDGTITLPLIGSVHGRRQNRRRIAK